MVPGRPRDDSVDDLVLTAALALMRDRGYGGLRIDDLVAQTGVAKTTMYRRWPSLAHLAVAAVERALGDRTVEPCADPAVELVRLLDRAFGSVAGDGALVPPSGSTSPATTTPNSTGSTGGASSTRCASGCANSWPTA